MKIKIVLLTSMLVVMSMLFFSCTTEPTQENPVLGKWEHNQKEFDGYTRYTFEYNSDNTASFSSSSISIDGTTLVSNISSGTYKVSTNFIEHNFTREHNTDFEGVESISNAWSLPFEVKGSTLLLDGLIFHRVISN